MPDEIESDLGWIAELDQMRRSVKDVASIVWSYYSGLLEEGFTESQALKLAESYIAVVMMGRFDG